MHLMLGDCLERMKEIPDNSVDSVVTDPPYALNFMGKKWDSDVPSTDIWTEALRVLKPGGHLLSFGGTRTYHRMVVAIEDAGFEIRDCIQWVYGSGFPKSHNLKEEWQGWGTALKPANEPIVVARKPLEKDLTVAQNVLKWGTGALNIDGSRIEAADQAVLDAAVKRMTGNVVTNANSKNFLEGQKEIKPNSAQGRWPANIIFDEEAAKALDEQSPNAGANGGKSCGFDWTKSGKNMGKEILKDKGGASRFFYVAKASKAERNAGLEGMPTVESSSGDKRPSGNMNERIHGKENRSPVLAQNHHPTVKPLKLGTYLQNLVTPPGGVTLDPFMGSGSFGVSAKAAGFKFIGIERDEAYFEIAKKRIESAGPVVKEKDESQLEFPA